MCVSDEPGRLGQQGQPAQLGQLGQRGRPGHPRAPLASTGQALAALQDALAFLATTDATALTVAEQADCLRGLQRAESVRIAAQTAVLDAFADGCGYAADGQGSARTLLRCQS